MQDNTLIVTVLVKEKKCFEDVIKKGDGEKKTLPSALFPWQH